MKLPWDPTGQPAEQPDPESPQPVASIEVAPTTDIGFASIDADAIYGEGNDIGDTKAPGGPIEDRWDKRRFEAKLVNPANRRKLSVIIVGTGLAGARAGSVTLEDLRNGHRGPLLDDLVDRDERPAQPLCNERAERRLPRAHEPDEREVPV